VKKDVRFKVEPSNGCDGRLMTKISISTIEVHLVPNPSEITKIIVIIKFFAIILPSQPFLGLHTSVFTTAFLGVVHFFTAKLFWTRYILTGENLNGCNDITVEPQLSEQ